YLHSRDQRTDLVLILGDIVYIDLPTIEPNKAYKHVWSDRSFQHLFSST
ncbi:unnamed protein product, partial [Didymodactylos carnosus]